jgi:hypothetical protein
VVIREKTYEIRGEQFKRQMVKLGNISPTPWAVVDFYADGIIRNIRLAVSVKEAHELFEGPAY